MDPFWGFAKRMLRYPGLLTAAGACAILSGGSLGAGLIGAQPVLNAILSREGKGLPELAAAWNHKGALAGRIPQSLIDSLPPGPFTALVWIMVALGVLTVVGAVANFLHAYLSLTVVNRTVTAIRREAFHRVLRLPLGLVLQGGDGPTGGGASDAISRIINDTGQLGQGLTALISKAVSQVAKGVGALIAALIVDWRLTCIALLIAPILFTIIRRLGKKIRRYSKKALASQGELYLAATESLQGLRVVKVHSAERFEAGRFHRINKRAMHELNKVRTARALASPLVETLSIFVLGTLVLIAGKTIMDRHMEPDQFLAALVALGAAGAALKPVTGLINDVQQSAAGADRLRDLMESPPEPGHDARLPKLPLHARAIEFRRVTLTYPRAARPSLNDVNLTIRHGERVAVVGPNGCGKTTLLALIPRLFDPDVPDASTVRAGSSEGCVLIDGRDIRSVNLRSLRRQVGVVTQETVLFKRSIRGNITYGTNGVSDEQMITAAKQARAHEFIMRLPQGYDTEVAEQGTSLSGGQRQRIAIARAILRDPAILILDEATSMIDADSEAQINAAINEFSRGRTTLIVAHRLSTVLSADRIVVMDHGRIVDSGGHAELLARCEIYQQLARHQLLGQADDAVIRPGPIHHA